MRTNTSDLRKNLRCGVGPSLVSIAILALFGCGGGDGVDGDESMTGQSSETQLATVSAQDATYSTGYSELFEVDLSSKVFSSTGGGFTLTDIEMLSNDSNCQIESITDSGFVIQASDTKVCSYRYHVAPEVSAKTSRQSLAPMSDSSSERSSSAITRVAVSSNPSSTELIPVSAVTLVNEDLDVSLNAELSKVGFNLGDEFILTEVNLPYERGSSAQISDSNDQVIEYVPPPSFMGIDRVLYTLEDSVNDRILMGVLDIAISYEGNQGLEITDHATYIVDEVDTPVIIDVSEYVTSLDDSDYQLVFVDSFNSTVEPVDSLNLSNKMFYFTAGLPGRYYVAFAVSDHSGAYEYGLLEVSIPFPDVIRIEGEAAIPRYELVSGNLVTESYSLLTVDAKGNKMPVDATWALESEFDGLFITTGGILTVDPSLELPKKSFFISAVTQDGRVAKLEIALFEGIIELLETDLDMTCEARGYASIDIRHAENILNSSYAQDLTGFNNNVYQADELYIDGRAPNIYGRLGPPGTTFDPLRPPVLYFCPYREGCERNGLGEAQHYIKLAYKEWAVNVTLYAPEEYLICQNDAQ